MQDELEDRDRLRNIWERLVDKLFAADFPQLLVYETLSEVANEGLARVVGPAGLASVLRLRADAIEESERRSLDGLLLGGDSGMNGPRDALASGRP